MSTKRKRKSNDSRSLSLPPIEYDPFMPGLSVLHRAGIAGLLFQIETMKKLRQEMPGREAMEITIPNCESIHDGRGIRLTFTEEGFYSLMRERYRGVLVTRIVAEANHKLRQGPKKKPKRYIFVGESDKGRFEYLDPRPLLRGFEVFKSHESWQEHARDAIWNSYYCIPNNRLIYKLPTEAAKNDKIDKLWRALCTHSEVGLDKPIFPTAFAKNLKNTEIKEDGETALLLHFWPLVAGHFVPINLKSEKDQKTRNTVLRNEWQSPVVVIPDVTNAEAFVEEFKDFLGTLGNPPSERLYEDGTKIATPLEASLAFFAAPRLARGTRAPIGARGAEVYVFRKRKAEKQPLVAAIVNESLDPRLLDGYRRLIEKKIYSLPFRAVCIQNLLAHPRQRLYEGFERLVDQFPLELFVTTRPREGKVRQFLTEGKRMARTLEAEIRYIRERELKKMNGEEKSIPFLIWRVTQNYIRWRACNKANPPINRKQVESVLAKLAKHRDETKLSSEEKYLLGRYNAAIGEVVEKVFIDFRGNREPGTFANAFSETFFRAPQVLGHKQAERLRPFYEGPDWESGRRLVLMAISATGANASSLTAEPDEPDTGDADEAQSTTGGDDE